MWKSIIGVLLTSTLVASSDNMLGPGEWQIHDIRPCDDDYEIKLEVNMQKANRTHDMFNANFTLEQTLDSSYSCKIKLEKKGDGGFKHFQTLSDDSFRNFVVKYAPKNFEHALTLAEVDPPDCPIEAGSYSINGYFLDKCDLPVEAVYGEFLATALLQRDLKDVGCAIVHLSFKETDEEICDS